VPAHPGTRCSERRTEAPSFLRTGIWSKQTMNYGFNTLTADCRNNDLQYAASPSRGFANAPDRDNDRDRDRDNDKDGDNDKNDGAATIAHYDC